MRPEEYKIRDFVSVCRARGLDIDQLTGILAHPEYYDKRPLEKKRQPQNRVVKALVITAICIETINLILNIALLLIELL